MDFDDLALSRHDDSRHAWNRKLSEVDPSVQFEEDGEEWMLRFPIPGKVMLVEQKLRCEVATMKYIKEKTNIPIPKVVAYGMADDNPTGLGPFLITTFIEGTPLGDMLKADSLDEEGDKILRSDIPDSTLRLVYQQIADVILELSEHDFDRIGTLSLDNDGRWSIGSGPLTLNMNELARCGDMHVEPRIYSTTADYLLDIAEQNILHLERQRNSVDSAADARLKYTSRHLFRAITPNFVSRKYNQGPFKLFCDDFRPGNILVDDSFKITGIIDWEWCYAAPFQFTYAPPRWLLLKQPAYWNSNPDKEDLLNVYLPKFELFISILEEQERCRRGPPTPNTDSTLSSLMRQSMTDMTFWFNEAARDSYALDRIYWSRLDSFCFGPSSGRKERANWLSRTEAHKGLTRFVNRKMEQLRQYKLELGVEQGPEEENDEDRCSKIEFPAQGSCGRISISLQVVISLAAIAASTYIFIRRQPR